MYTVYVVIKYGSAVVAFDGYEGGSSTKDCAHLMRRGDICSNTINFTGNMVMNSSKQQILSHPSNKQRFINILSSRLIAKGCTTHHAGGNADLITAMKVIDCSRQFDTILVGDDTYLLIILLYLVGNGSSDIFFKLEQKKKVKSAKVW